MSAEYSKAHFLDALSCVLEQDTLIEPAEFRNIWSRQLDCKSDKFSEAQSDYTIGLLKLTGAIDCFFSKLDILRIVSSCTETASDAFEIFLRMYWEVNCTPHGFLEQLESFLKVGLWRPESRTSMAYTIFFLTVDHCIESQWLELLCRYGFDSRYIAFRILFDHLQSTCSSPQAKNQLEACRNGYAESSEGIKMFQYLAMHLERSGFIDDGELYAENVLQTHLGKPGWPKIDLDTMTSKASSADWRPNLTAHFQDPHRPSCIQRRKVRRFVED